MTTASDVLRAMFDHHRWATEGLIDHLAGLPPERLDQAIPGTYGSILQTLTHLVDGDDRYLIRLRDPSPAGFVDRDAVPLEQLRVDARAHARRWQQALDELDEGTLDAAIVGREGYPDTQPAEALLMLQAIHHGNDHRTQICSTLGALGEKVPDLDGWDYWAGGRA